MITVKYSLVNAEINKYQLMLEVTILYQLHNFNTLSLVTKQLCVYVINLA